MKSLIVLVLALLAAPLCAAEYVLVDDLHNCLWRDGSKIKEKECHDLIQKLDDVSQRREVFQNKLESPRTLKSAARLLRGNLVELVDYTEELMDRAYKVNIEEPDRYGWEIGKEVAGVQMMMPKFAEERTPLELEIEDIIEVKKRRCGSDYKKLYVGMKVGLMIVCYGGFYESKTVSPEGTVDIYRTMYDWVQVQDGIVINYIRQKN